MCKLRVINSLQLQVSLKFRQSQVILPNMLNSESVKKLSGLVLIATSLFACICVRAAESEMVAQYIPELISISAGSFIKGSSDKEREYAYQLDESAYKHSATREGRWYARESGPQQIETAAFEIGRTPVTNKQYQIFIEATGYPAPTMDAETWASYRLVHPFESTTRFVWGDGIAPSGREDHPVVLVSYEDANAYAEWLSERTGDVWRLPRLDEWERAARGDDGWVFPWGNEFDAALLNSHDQGPFDTQPVGMHPKGASSHLSLIHI